MVARPFFMTLPGYPGRMDEKEILNDLEYLQQTYPGEVRRCQRRIAEILDKYDYEGSMIYDEYPDMYNYVIKMMFKDYLPVRNYIYSGAGSGKSLRRSDPGTGV